MPQSQFKFCGKKHPQRKQPQLSSKSQINQFSDVITKSTTTAITPKVQSTMIAGRKVWDKQDQITVSDAHLSSQTTAKQVWVAPDADHNMSIS